MTFDSATSKEVGAPEDEEIEVTAKMIEAGADAISGLFGDPGGSRAALRMAAEDCFRAMATAAGS